MKTILFNVHDLILIVVLSACALLAALTYTTTRFRATSKHILIAFFTMNGFIAIDTLVFWGEGLKYAAFSLSPWLLTVFSFATFAFGPVLYGFIKSELNGKPYAHWSFYLHFVPALLTPIYLYWVCYRFPIDVQRELILNFGVYSAPQAYFSSFISLKKLVPVLYGFMCFRLVYKELAKNAEANLEMSYLLYLTLGFTCIRLWILLTHACGLFVPISFGDFMGISGNYMTLAFLIGLVWISLRPRVEAPRSLGESSYQGVSNLKESAPNESTLPEIDGLKDSVKSFVELNKPYLNSQLTLERFAALIDLPVRQVSSVINKGFRKNFQEFINDYRIEEAKVLLSSSDMSEKTVLEIASLSGFNSKASFNRAFKQHTSLTPSAFRSKYTKNLTEACA